MTKVQKIHERTNFFIMLKRKNITRILFLVLTVILMMALMTGCAKSSSIDTSKTLEDWVATDDNGNLTQEVTFEDDKSFVDYILLYIGTFIKWITNIMPAHSYILALFIFAIVIEVIMLPFSIMQQKNSKKQAMLRPKEMAIRKKYAGRNDQATQQKVNQEIQELYQKEQFNPMSGCLPLLIQLPIIMALYSIVINPLRYVMNMGGTFVNFLSTYMQETLGVKVATNGTIGFISTFKEVIADKGIEAFEGVKTACANGDAVYEHVESLAKATESINLNVGPINMGYIPSFTPDNKIYYWLLAVPVLTFLVYFFSSKITRKFTYQPTQNTSSNDPQSACSTKMMDWMMPLMSVWMTFIVPAAVGIYWMFKSIVSTVKQIIISKVMPMPQFTEEDYKAAEREYAGKHPQKVTKSENAGKVRSLHHIDDEDYDELGNYVPVEKAEYIETTVEEEKKPESLPENKMTDGASLKDESDKTKKDKNSEKKNKWFNKK